MKQGWEIKKLGEVCETSSGGTPSKSHQEYYEGGNIPWLRSGEVSQGLIYDTELYITAEGLDNSSAKIFPIDTVVIAMYGATVGQVGILKKAMSTNQAICGIFPNTQFAPLFLVYYLRAKKTYFLSLAAGGAQPNISQQIIRETEVPIPPLPEQEKIVAELDCLSGIIEKKKQQLKELDALAESIFYTMFGDPITNEKGWEVKRLGEVCKFSQGIQVDLPLQSTEKKTGWNKFLRIVDYTTNNSDIRYVNINNEKYYVKFDDVVVVRYGASAGVVGIKQEGILANNLFKLNHSKDKLNYIYLYCLLSTNYYKTFVKETAFGAAMPALNFNSFKIFNIIIPPLSLQQEFASKIEAIEKQKELIKESIKETETLFNARMQYYFG